MTLRYSISSVLQHRPLAIGLALALALPVSGAISVGVAAPVRNTPIHRSPIGNAATLPVTSCADDGSAGTLRTVVAAAASGDTVDLSQLSCSSITLTQGEIAVAQDDLTLSGPGASALAISGGAASRVFAHSGTGTLSIDALGIADGYTSTYGGCIQSAGSVYLNESTVSNCRASISHYGSGGGLYVVGNLTLVDSLISNNQAYLGGGIYVKSDLAMTNSTVSYNSATFDIPNGYGRGGGAWARGSHTTISGSTISGNHAGGNVAGLAATPNQATAYDFTTITNSTISGNIVDGTYGTPVGGAFIYTSVTISNSTVAFNEQHSGCGVFIGSEYGIGSVVNLQSSILANNTPGNTGTPCDFTTFATGVVVNGANDIIMGAQVPVPTDTVSDDPLLLPLADNGGPTLTHALASGSPAIDAGNNLLGLTFDQRGNGYPRVFGVAADIGAFEAQQSSAAPSVTKSFTPSSVMVDAFSTLTITLGNGTSSAATLSAALTDSLPTPVVIANPPGASTTCAGGTLIADAGAGAATLNAGAQIPAAGTCTITVSVVAHSAGTYTNLIAAGDLQTDTGTNPDPATADLSVTGVPVPPSVSKAFAPNTIVAGASSILTITLANSHPTPATLTADLTDSLPPPLVVADPANATTTCTRGVVSADTGAAAVTLAAGAEIPSGTCTVSVSVTADAVGAYVNAIPAGALQTDFGNNPDTVHAGLTVTPSVPTDTIFADGFDGSAP